jgi:methylmalonyl-CoA/ethylmalonyl-CoA epimerase
MSNTKKISHVAIVVDDIEAAMKFWRDGLGLDFEQIKEVPEQESRVAFLTSGDSEIELVEPTSDDSGIARFLEKRGPGMHHVCFEVQDIHISLDHLTEIGVRLINESPRISSDGKLYAFIHPESTNGVLVELYQLPIDS